MKSSVCPGAVSKDPSDLTSILREVIREIHWVADEEIQLDADDGITGRWNSAWIKGAIWTLVETFLPLSDDPSRTELRLRQKNGWAQLDFEILGNPFRKDERVALVRHSHGEDAQIPSRPRLSSIVQSMDFLTSIAEAHEGLLMLQAFSDSRFTLSLVLPTAVATSLRALG